MERMAKDLFQHKSNHYLVLVDRFLGYPWIHLLMRLSSEAIIKKLNGWFLQFGYPHAIRSNGSPQFCSPFKKFCSDNGIIHEVTSPYNSRSNDLAEVNVHLLKQILDKVGEGNFKSAFSA